MPLRGDTMHAMVQYLYIARTASGERVTGTLSGGSEQHVLAELQQRQLAPVRVEPIHERRAIRRRVGARQLAQAYRQLGDLLRAGVPLLRGLRLIGRSKSNPRLATAMNEVADAVADGERLADAMAAHHGVFPDIHIAMIRAGERGGFLEQVLHRMGTFLEHQADMRGKVLGSLIYPAALITVGVGIVIYALVFFVPSFQQFYSGIELPVSTRILLGASDLFTRMWMGMVVAIALLAAGAWWLLKRPEVVRRLAVIQLKVPAFGPLVQSLAVARFTRILGTLLENGIPLLQAMQISRDAAGHVLLAEAIDEAIEAIRAGETLAEPLAASGLLTDDVIEMITVGESANNLPEVLVTIAETIEKRVDRMLSVAMRLLEPLLLLMIAGVVLFIFMALVVPMMRLSQAV
jgi:general secretion pathway protein F